MKGNAIARSGASPPRAPNCLKCDYFAVSWDPAFPRSCTVFGIKSRQIPSLLVFESTGRHCPAFKLSERLKKGPG